MTEVPAAPGGETLRRRLMRMTWAIQRHVLPGLRYSQFLYQEMLERLTHGDSHWLDLGCGHRMLAKGRLSQEKELVGRARRVVGIDYDLPSLRQHQSISELVRGSVDQLPFKEQRFDLVSANMVVEHLAAPVEQFREIRRVLRPGGRFVFHTPNRRGYTVRMARLVPEGLKSRLVRLIEGRAAADVFPTFYRANTTADVAEAARQAGLVVEDIRLVATAPEFAALPPVALFELLWIRLLLKRPLRQLRTNLLVVLRRM